MMFALATSRTGVLSALNSQQQQLSVEQATLLESQRAQMDEANIMTQQLEPAPTMSRRGPLPSLPYYGLLSQLFIEIGGTSCDDAMVDTTVCSSSAAARKLQERCSYFHFGADLNSAVAPTGCDGARYVDALCDAFKRLVKSWRSIRSSPRKRQRDDEEQSDFVGFYVLCREHLEWHNWGALFFVEDNKLSAMLVGDSPTFRRVVLQQALEVGVSSDTMQWIDGAVFAQYDAHETTHAGGSPSNSSQRINEVAAFFDIILNLKLFLSATGREDTAIPAGIQQPFAAGPAASSGALTILCSFPFQYGEWRQMRLVVADPVVFFSRELSPTSPTSPSNSVVFQKRRRWTVGGGASFVILPHTLGGIIKTLQRDVGLSAFTVVCGSHFNAAMTKSAIGASSAARGPVSLTDSQANTQRLLAARRTAASPTLNVSTCFSRLSAQSWGASEGTGSDEVEFFPQRISCFADGTCELALQVIRSVDVGVEE